MSSRRRLAILAIAAGLFIAAVASSAPSGSASPSNPKLRGELEQLLSGERELDSRVPGLVAGYQPGELPYFAVLSEPNDAVHRAQITALGARVLQQYRSVDAFALASDPATVSSVAALPWVEWLTPVEVVVALDHQSEQDQSRGKTADVGAPPLWNAGLTGEGVRIAVLDTGIDPTHQDLDDLDFRHWDGVLSEPKLVEARNFVGSTCDPLTCSDRSRARSGEKPCTRAPAWKSRTMSRRMESGSCSSITTARRGRTCIDFPSTCPGRRSLSWLRRSTSRRRASPRTGGG